MWNNEHKLTQLTMTSMLKIMFFDAFDEDYIQYKRYINIINTSNSSEDTRKILQKEKHFLQEKIKALEEQPETSNMITALKKNKARLKITSSLSEKLTNRNNINLINSELKKHEQTRQ